MVDAGRPGPVTRLIYWEYDEEDYPGVISRIVNAVRELGENGTKPVDAVDVPSDISPDVAAVMISTSTLTGRDLGALFEQAFSTDDDS